MTICQENFINKIKKKKFILSDMHGGYNMNIRCNQFINILCKHNIMYILNIYKYILFIK